MINKISDLKPGNDYYLIFVDDARFAKKCTLLAIINEFPGTGHTELYVEMKSGGTKLPFAYEIGIGETKSEALSNYAKFKFEASPTFSKSYAEEYNKWNKSPIVK